MSGWRCGMRMIIPALAMTALLGSAAAAQSSAAAEALFRAGRKASAQGDHATACAKYRESYRMEQAFGTLLNIAVCEEALGQLASAWQRYQEVLHGLDPSDTRLELARARLKALERRVPFITVQLAEGAPDGAQIEIGKTQLSAASFGVELPWDPGAHELRVLAFGHAPRAYPFELVEGERRKLEVDVGEPVPPEEQETPAVVAPVAERVPASEPAVHASALPSEPRDNETERLLSYAALGLGGGALALSGVSFIVTLDRKSVVDDRCPGGECDDIGARAANAGRDWLTVSWVSLAVGAVSVALGAYGLWATDDDGAASSASPMIDPSGVRVRF